MNELLDATMSFFLRQIARELSKELDWRAGGHGRNFLVRAAIYLAALVRDLIRIPTHHREGIAQARFRARIDYITHYAVPALEFFRANYPLDEGRREGVGDAVELLHRAEGLVADGSNRTLDEWYATMEEFYELSELSKEAVTRIMGITADAATVSASA